MSTEATRIRLVLLLLFRSLVKFVCYVLLKIIRHYKCLHTLVDTGVRINVSVEEQNVDLIRLEQTHETEYQRGFVISHI